MSDDENTKPLRVYFGHGKRGKSVTPPVEIDADYEAELDAIRDSFNACGHWYFGKLIFDALRGIKK